MAVTQATEGQLFIQANHDGGFDFIGDCSLIDLSPSRRKFTLAYKSDLWFAPKATLTNAGASSLEYTERDGEMVAEFVTQGDGVEIRFTRWWHRPIWWMYGRWVKLWGIDDYWE